MANRIVKIEDICHVVKGETGIMKAIPGEFPMVVLSEERKTHNEFQFDCKAVIIPLVSSTGHGHASMKRIHYQEGKFALGSILCALIPKNEGEYDPEYLYHILDMGKERIFVPLMKGMANVSLPMNRIKSVEINLPPYDEQVRLSKIYSEVTTNLDLLRNQTDKQRKYLKQLRQTILQLAVQGKLTAKWREENPNVEPAYVLLEKIKAEKDKLIQEGKIKREKPLPKIAENEKPFNIPENWEWTRLQNLSNNIHYGFNASAKPDLKEVRLLRITDIQDNKVEWENVPGCEYNSKDLETYLLSENDIVIARTGGTIGKSYLVKNLPCKSLFASYLIRLIPNALVFPEYLKLFIESPFYWTQLYEYAWGAAQPNVNGTKLSSLITILPPFEEQKVIVSVVNRLMLLCDELEKKIEKRDSFQDRIMQAVVKQAFQSGAKEII